MKQQLTILFLLALINQKPASLDAFFYQSHFYDFNLDLTVLATVPTDDELVAVGMQDGGVTIWNHATGIGLNLHQTRVGQPRVHALINLDNGNLAATATETISYQMKIWNGSWSSIASPTIQVPGAFVELSPGSFASATQNSSIVVWDLDTLAITQTLTGHNASVQKLIRLVDGRLASASDDGTIRIWNLTAGVAVSVQAHIGGVNDIIQLSSGDICSCGEDLDVKVWSISDMSLKANLSGHNDSVNAVYELASGELASGSEDTTIKLWNSTSGVCSATLTGHTSGVNTLVEMSNGILISGSDDDSLRVWRRSAFFSVTPFLVARKLGCYLTVTGSPDLVGLSPPLQSANMTHKECFSACLGAGFTYAGLEQGNTCSCDSSYGTYGIVPEKECSTPCGGGVGPDEWCGGTGRVYVFDIRNSSVDLAQLLELDVNTYSETVLLQAIESVNSLVGEMNTVNVDERADMIGGISEMLNRIANRNTSEESVTVVRKFFDVVDAVLMQGSGVIEVAQSRTESSAKFVDSLEKMSAKTRMAGNETALSFEFDNLILKVTRPRNESSLEYLGVVTSSWSGQFNQAAVNGFIRAGRLWIFVFCLLKEFCLKFFGYGSPRVQIYIKLST